MFLQRFMSFPSDIAKQELGLCSMIYTIPPLPPGEGRGEGGRVWSSDLTSLTLTLSQRERGRKTSP